MASVKKNYIVIPSIVAMVAILGSYCTSLGMPWYRTLQLPSFTPPGSVIGAVWTVLYILTAIAALIIWNGELLPMTRKAIAMVFLLNALLNLAWSFLFFASQQILIAVFDAAALGLSVAVLIAMIRPISRLASYLLVPYFLWVCFATYLNYSIWRLNA